MRYYFAVVFAFVLVAAAACSLNPQPLPPLTPVDDSGPTNTLPDGSKDLGSEGGGGSSDAAGDQPMTPGPSLDASPDGESDGAGDATDAPLDDGSPLDAADAAVD